MTSLPFIWGSPFFPLLGIIIVWKFKPNTKALYGTTFLTMLLGSIMNLQNGFWSVVRENSQVFDNKSCKAVSRQQTAKLGLHFLHHT